MSATAAQSDSNLKALAHLPFEGVKQVAYQGVPGAYSHVVCSSLFPTAEAISCQNFEDAFGKTIDGECMFSVIPIENSLGGRVSDVHQLLPDSGLHIVGEYFLPIHHYLWGSEGASLDTITEVHSHEQALSQCRTNLKGLGVKTVPTSDTAGAARDLAQSKNTKIGVLSSKLAGEIYGLNLIRSRMEDRFDNVTRFILLSRNAFHPAYKQGEDYITSFYFVARSVPAALYKCLGGFATNQINIIRLESYISLTSPNQVSFYVEIENHPTEKMMDHALQELQFFTTHTKIIGVYHKSDYRRTLGGKAT